MRSPLIFAALLVVACSRASSPEPSDPRPTRACRKVDPPPRLEPPPDLDAIISHVTVRASITEQRLRQEIARELPETLDAGQRTMSGVRVNYVVKRGDLAFELEDDGLVLSTPIRASASVCKTLGPLCPVLGRCTPQLDVRVRVPIVLSSDYSYDPSKVTVNLVRGCTIAGFNASGEIQSQASSEARSAQQQIDRQLPPIREPAVAGWQELHRTLMLDGGACLRTVPRGVQQERPKRADGVISSAASISGELTLEQPCSDGEAPETSELPPLEVSDRVPSGVKLQAPLHLKWDQVLAALNESLDGKVPVRRLAVQSAAIAKRPRLVLELERDDDPCGPLWLTAEPWFDADQGAIRLRDIALVPDWNPKRKLGELPANLERHARIPLPVDLTDLRNQLDRTRAQHVPVVEEVDVEIELGTPEVKRVALDARGLVPVVSVTGAAAVRGE